MRKQHRKKRVHASEQKLPAKRPGFKGFDNTRDIDLILSKGKLPQDLLGFSGQRIGKLFETAIGLLQANRFDEATSSFKLLTHLNPYISDFWLGLGLAYMGIGSLHNALSDFLVAQTMDPSRSEPYIYATDCCFEMNDFAQAQAIITAGLAYAKKYPRREETKIMAHELHSRERILHQKLKKAA